MVRVGSGAMVLHEMMLDKHEMKTRSIMEGTPT